MGLIEIIKSAAHDQKSKSTAFCFLFDEFYYYVIWSCAASNTKQESRQNRPCFAYTSLSPLFNYKWFLHFFGPKIILHAKPHTFCLLLSTFLLLLFIYLFISFIVFMLFNWERWGWGKFLEGDIGDKHGFV